MATTDILWGLSILMVLVGVCFLMRWLEFDPGFEKRMYRLNPSDLRLPILANTMDGVIGYKQVAKIRFSYIACSLLFLIAVSGTIVCSDLIRKPVSQIFPPVIFNILEEAQEGNRLRSIFWHLIAFTFGFHLLPILSAVTNSTSQSSLASSSSGIDRVGRALASLLMFQRWFLDRMITRLLRYRATSPEDSQEDDGIGGIQSIVISKIADLISKRVKQTDIEAEYWNLLARIPASSLGAGAASMHGGKVTPPSSHQMVIDIIDRKGIPYVLKRFKLNPQRVGSRKPVSLSFRGVIDGLQSEGMIENFGDTGKKGRWNSFLVSIPDNTSDLANRIKRNLPVRLNSIGGQKVNDALRCVVKRVNTIGNSGEVWIGVVVEDDEIDRFSEIVRNICGNSKKKRLFPIALFRL